MKALISVTRKTKYTSIIEMKQEDFDKFNAMLGGNHKERLRAERELDAKIDNHDWQDDELDSLNKFEPFAE